MRLISKKENLLSGLAALIATLSIFSTVLIKGKLLGDLLDARFTIVVNDHWYQFITGNQSFSNLGFYFPNQNQLGFSDAFLATGLLSIPLRVFGLTVINSWLISNMVLSFICFFFAAKFLGIVLNNKLSGALLTILFASSYPFIAQLGHLQTFGYLLVFPILYFLRAVYYSPNTAIRSAMIVVLLFELLSLSAWYAFVFCLALISIMLGFLSLFFGARFLRDKFLDVWSNLKFDFNSFSLLARVCIICATLPMPIAWLKIYYAGFDQISNKGYGEFVFYAPRWGDLFNSVNQSWGIQRVFNELTHQRISGSFERALGFTPILLVLTLLMICFLAYPSKFVEHSVKKWALTLFCTGLIPSLILVTDDEGHSLWRFIWVLIEPIRSIRVPFRVSIFTTWIILFAIFYVLSKSKAKGVLIVFVFALIFIDTWRPIPANWSRTQELSKVGQEIKVTLENQKCDYFFVNPSSTNREPWITQVEAMMISNQTGIPTINGYSGNWPEGWPITPYWGGASKPDVEIWVSESKDSKLLRGCYINEDAPGKALVIHP